MRVYPAPTAPIPALLWTAPELIRDQQGEFASKVGVFSWNHTTTEEKVKQRSCGSFCKGKCVVFSAGRHLFIRDHLLGNRHEKHRVGYRERRD